MFMQQTIAFIDIQQHCCQAPSWLQKMIGACQQTLAFVDN
jgi:hypothetical protein